MTIALSANTPRVSYTVNESATQTAFTVNFEFFDAADLNFYVDGTLKTLTTHYTVAGGDGAVGTINTSAGNTVTGASGGSTVVITRDIALARTTDFPSSGAFQIGALNTELDRFVAIASDLKDSSTRSLQLADDDSASTMTLPTKASRLGKVLGFHSSSGIAEVVSQLTAAATTVSTVSVGGSATASVSTSGNTATFALGIPTGATGSQGIQGLSGYGLSMTWDTDTTDADSGVGKVFGNNATIASISVLYLDDVDDSSVNIASYVQSWDDVVNATARGYIQITKEGTASTYAIFKINNAITDATGYNKIPVAHVVSNGTLSDGDGVTVAFVQSGGDGSGSMDSFILTGDSGSNQTIADGNTLDIEGGTGIATVVGATDKVTINGTDATASAKGIASFSAADFDVSSGAVTLDASIKKAGKESIWVPAGAMYPSTTNPCSDLEQVETTALRPDLKVLDFAANADDFAQFSIAFPKSWNEGTITYQAFWTVTGTNTGTVVWQLGGIAVTSDATINTAFGTLIATTALAHSGTSNDLMVSAESGAVTIGGSPSTDDVCFFQINNDTSASGQTGDVRLVGIKVFFTTDSANDS